MQPPFQLFVNFLYVFLKVSDGRSFPPALSPEEEHRLFVQWKGGDDKAREKLIEHNLRLVAHIVKKYYTNAQNQEDLISIGTIGLIKAIDSFKMENGARFATYASRCLQNEILMHFRSQKKKQYEVSMSEPIDQDKDGNPVTYGDIICEEDNIADQIFEKISITRAIKCINDCLNKRERQIILMRYGLGNRAAITQREVATQLNISRSYVSRIEKAAIEKIQRYLDNL